MKPRYDVQLNGIPAYMRTVVDVVTRPLSDGKSCIGRHGAVTATICAWNGSMLWCLVPSATSTLSPSTPSFFFPGPFIPWQDRKVEFVESGVCLLLLQLLVVRNQIASRMHLTPNFHVSIHVPARREELGVVKS